MKTTIKDRIIEVLKGKESMGALEICSALPNINKNSLRSQLDIHKECFERTSRGIYKLREQSAKPQQPEKGIEEEITA